MRFPRSPHSPITVAIALVVLVVGGTLLGGCAADDTSVDTGSAAESSAAEADASGLLPLPELTACTSTEHPQLPAKWRATALLQDFVHDQLTFGKFTYDESASAFRFQLANQYGFDLDFLVTEDRKLYQRYQLSQHINVCALVTDDSPLTVPSRDWLDDKAVCVGEGDILDKNVAWWKTPSGAGANWIWYDTASAMPFRTMYFEDQPLTDPVPVYEHFTFDYWPTFEEVESTDLAEMLAECMGSDAEPRLEGFDPAAPDAMASMEVAEMAEMAELDTEAMALAQSWIPGLDACSPDWQPVTWPDQVQGTVMMTAVSFDPNPFPTRLFYDWTQQAQNTSLYYAPPTATDYVQVALLLGDTSGSGPKNTGYIRIEDQSGNVSMCQQALPGPQVPNWQQVDGCECRARLAPGTVLNPKTEATNILWCPTDLSADQVFWTWYGDSGTPVVFMQTNSSPTAGTGLNLADYYQWDPGSQAPAGTFDLPAACEGEPKVTVPTACHNCHLPLNK